MSKDKKDKNVHTRGSVPSDAEDEQTRYLNLRKAETGAYVEIQRIKALQRLRDPSSEYRITKE